MIFRCYALLVPSSIEQGNKTKPLLSSQLARKLAHPLHDVANVVPNRRTCTVYILMAIFITIPIPITTFVTYFLSGTEKIVLQLLQVTSGRRSNNSKEREIPQLCIVWLMAWSYPRVSAFKYPLHPPSSHQSGGHFLKRRSLVGSRESCPSEVVSGIFLGKQTNIFN